MDTHSIAEAEEKVHLPTGPSRVIVCLHLVLFASGIILNLWALRRLNFCSPQPLLSWGSGPQSTPLRNFPLERFAANVPVKYDAELFSTSVYKGQPRKELDDAWEKLVDHPMVLEDLETLQAFDSTTKPSKGVDDHYYATVEVFHHLHCWDITRKFIWRGHYQHIDTFQNPPEVVWKHIDHCIDLLRQVLMCYSATGLLFYTDLGSQQPEPRVSTSHMCRNFTQISKWAWEHDSELGIYAETNSLYV